MSQVIILSVDDNAAVEGISLIDPLHALAPISLTDGTYFLPVDVLDDPAHEAHRALLSTLPIVDVSTIAALIRVSPFKVVS